MHVFLINYLSRNVPPGFDDDCEQALKAKQPRSDTNADNKWAQSGGVGGVRGAAASVSVSGRGNNALCSITQEPLLRDTVMHGWVISPTPPKRASLRESSKKKGKKPAQGEGELATSHDSPAALPTDGLPRRNTARQARVLPRSPAARDVPWERVLISLAANETVREAPNPSNPSVPAAAAGSCPRRPGRAPAPGSGWGSCLGCPGWLHPPRGRTGLILAPSHPRSPRHRRPHHAADVLEGTGSKHRANTGQTPSKHQANTGQVLCPQDFRLGVLPGHGHGRASLSPSSNTAGDTGHGPPQRDGPG